MAMLAQANTYRSSLKREMTWLGKQKGVVFLGQGITKGDRIYGTMSGVPKSRCIEQPIAENLTMGIAIGMAMIGYRPIVIFQRMDFMLIAADQIINHLALIPKMSHTQYRLPVMIRACIGSQDTTFDVGPQHKHNFKHIFSPYIATVPYTKYKYVETYDRDYPHIIVEEKDKYDDIIKDT